MEASTPLTFMSRIALVDVVAAGTHLVEAGRIGSPVLRRPALHRVETEARDLLAFDQPGVGPVVSPNHAGNAVLVLGGDVVGEEVAERRRLDHVVVDADEDEIFGLHATPPGLRAMQ